MTNLTAVPPLTPADVPPILLSGMVRDYYQHVVAAVGSGRGLTPAELQAHARAALALRTAMMDRLDRNGYGLVVTALQAGVSVEQAAESLGWDPDGLRMCILGWQADLRREGRLDEAGADEVVTLAGIRTMSAC